VSNLDGKRDASVHRYLELSVWPDGAVGHEALRVGKTHLRTGLCFSDHGFGDKSHNLYLSYALWEGALIYVKVERLSATQQACR
jgi:hypothetical protein